MIDLTHIILSLGVMKSLLLLIPTNLMPEENFEDFLNNDGFTYDPKIYGDKKFLFDELEKLKKEFREVIQKETELTYKDGSPLPFLAIYNWINAQKNQINKVRLIIKHEISTALNKHKPSDVNYIVVRSYWINNEGKKFRKFAKNLGPEDKVLVNNEIPQYKLAEAEKEIDRMMWEQYKSEYKI